MNSDSPTCLVVRISFAQSFELVVELPFSLFSAVQDAMASVSVVLEPLYHRFCPGVLGSSPPSLPSSAALQDLPHGAEDDEYSSSSPPFASFSVRSGKAPASSLIRRSCSSPSVGATITLIVTPLYQGEEIEALTTTTSSSSSSSSLTDDDQPSPLPHYWTADGSMASLLSSVSAAATAAATRPRVCLTESSASVPTNAMLTATTLVAATNHTTPLVASPPSPATTAAAAAATTVPKNFRPGHVRSTSVAAHSSLASSPRPAHLHVMISAPCHKDMVGRYALPLPLTHDASGLAFVRGGGRPQQQQQLQLHLQPLPNNEPLLAPAPSPSPAANLELVSPRLSYPSLRLVCPSSNLMPDSEPSFVSATRQGLLANHTPRLADEGEGGAWFMYNPLGDKVAVFKPCDQDPFSPLNPKARSPTAAAAAAATAKNQAIQDAMTPNSSSLKEVAAYVLDRALGGKARVPETWLTELSHPALSGGAAKVGSLQHFVASRCSAEDVGTSRFSTRDVHYIGLLDLMLLNCDRHAGNLLVDPLPPHSQQQQQQQQAQAVSRNNSNNKPCGAWRSSRRCAAAAASASSSPVATTAVASTPATPAGAGAATASATASMSTTTAASNTNLLLADTDKDESDGYDECGKNSLVPIDHAFSLPEAPFLAKIHSNHVWFEWMNYAQARKPFSSCVRKYVAAIDIEKRAAELEAIGLNKQSVMTMRMCTFAVQRAVAAGRTLYDIGKFFCQGGLSRCYEQAADACLPTPPAALNLSASSLSLSSSTGSLSLSGSSSSLSSSTGGIMATERLYDAFRSAVEQVFQAATAAV